MTPLDDLQRALAASLAGRADPPPGVLPAEVRQAAHALVAKRRRAAGHVLPSLRLALGTGWRARFEVHARSYAPAGLLYHVDDAWAFAEALSRDPSPALRAAAAADIARLRRGYVRRADRHVWRVAARGGFSGVVGRIETVLRGLLGKP